MRPRAEDRDEAILDVVVRLLESEGYEAVQVRRVASEAAVSLATIYKLFGTRDELIVRALERWMIDNAYAGLGVLAPRDTPYETLAAIVRSVFAPWERQPHMLAAYIRARMAPGGARLWTQGIDLVGPLADEQFSGFDAGFVEDAWMIVEHVLLAALSRFAVGEIDVTAIVPILERTLYRLFSDEPAVSMR